MKIDFQVIPHNKQRYDTCGDWFWDEDNNLQLRVSKLSDRRYEWLVALHELIEAVLSTLMGITDIEVDGFDIAYEKARESGAKKAHCGCRIQDEPGNDRHCPVYKQHKVASLAERAMAKLLKVNWRKYDEEVESL